MKREIPVFQYDDAWQILAKGDRLNGLVIDAGSEEVMLRIDASMSKLKVMGDDDRRFFWIWALFSCFFVILRRSRRITSYKVPFS